MLYWSDNGGIMASGMDGSNHTLVKSGSYDILSLTIDTKGKYNILYKYICLISSNIFMELVIAEAMPKRRLYIP